MPAPLKLASSKLHCTVKNDSLFDDNPIVIGGFELRAREAVPVPGGKPTIKGWQSAFVFAIAAGDSSAYWPGDLLAYAEDRTDWREKIDQAVSITKRSRRTLQNETSICRKVKGRARDISPSISHSAIVTKLEQAEQEELLERARVEELTVSELTHIVRKRKTPLTGQAAEVHDVTANVLVSVEAMSAGEAERIVWDAIKGIESQLKANAAVLAVRLLSTTARPK